MTSRAGAISRAFGFSAAWAVIGVVIVVLFSTQKPNTAFALVAGPIVVASAVLSGNPRLFFLWGLLLSIPIEFSKYFLNHFHQGGEWAFRIELSDVFLSVLLGYWMVDLARDRGWRVQVPRAGIYWTLLIGMAVGTVALGTYRIVAAMEVVRMTKLLMLFLFICNGLRQKDQFRHVAIAIVVGMFLQSFYGLLQYFFDVRLGIALLGESEIMKQQLGGSTHRRIGSLLGHPNLLSAYLAMVLPVAVAMLFSRISVWIKLALSIACLLALTALILTLSRNGWIGFGFAAVVIIVLSNLNRGVRVRTSLLRAGLVVVLGVVALAASPKIIERITMSDPTSVSARWELNYIAWEMVKDRPILGFGKNSTAYAMVANPEYHLSNHILSSDTTIIPPIHNIYMQQWVEQGTVGMIIFMAMLAVVVRQGLANLRIRDDTMFALNLGVFAGMLSLLLNGLADWPFWWNGMTRMYWLYAGMIMAMHYWNVREERRLAAASAPGTAAP